MMELWIYLELKEEWGGRAVTSLVTDAKSADRISSLKPCSDWRRQLCRGTEVPKYQAKYPGRVLLR